MQIKTRVAGVLAISAAAIAIMGGPAFASNNPVADNIVGIRQRQLPGRRRGLPGQLQRLS